MKLSTATVIKVYPQQFYPHVVFENPPPEPVAEEDLAKRNGSFSVQDVITWVEKHDLIDGCFQCFEVFTANSEFYLKVAKPLLSM